MVDRSTLRISFPVEVRIAAGRRHHAVHGLRPGQRVHRRPHLQGHALPGVLHGGRADHHRARGPAALGQDAHPRRGATSPGSIRASPSSRRCGTGSTRTAVRQRLPAAGLGGVTALTARRLARCAAHQLRRCSRKVLGVGVGVGVGVDLSPAARNLLGETVVVRCRSPRSAGRGRGLLGAASPGPGLRRAALRPGATAVRGSCEALGGRRRSLRAGWRRPADGLAERGPLPDDGLRPLPPRRARRS